MIEIARDLLHGAVYFLAWLLWAVTGSSVATVIERDEWRSKLGRPVKFVAVVTFFLLGLLVFRVADFLIATFLK